MGDRFEDGLALRRKVLGDAHVDRSLKARDEFTTDVQQIITEIGWGTIWARPGLTMRERSMATVSFLVALGKAHELEHHLLGALRNGCTKTELKELFLHAALYCGFPAAQEGIRALRKVSAEYEADAGKGD